MPMPYMKRKSKEVDVIAQDMESAEKIEDYVNILVSDTSIMIWPAITLVFA